MGVYSVWRSSGHEEGNRADEKGGADAFGDLKVWGSPMGYCSRVYLLAVSSLLVLSSSGGTAWSKDRYRTHP